MFLQFRGNSTSLFFLIKLRKIRKVQLVCDLIKHSIQLLLRLLSIKFERLSERPVVIFLTPMHLRGCPCQIPLVIISVRCRRRRCRCRCRCVSLLWKRKSTEFRWWNIHIKTSPVLFQQSSDCISPKRFVLNSTVKWKLHLTCITVCWNFKHKCLNLDRCSLIHHNTDWGCSETFDVTNFSSVHVVHPNSICVVRISRFTNKLYNLTISYISFMIL